MIRASISFRRSINETAGYFSYSLRDILLLGDTEIDVYIGKRSHKDEEESRYKHEWFRKHVYWFERIVHLPKPIT